MVGRTNADAAASAASAEMVLGMSRLLFTTRGSWGRGIAPRRMARMGSAQRRVPRESMNRGCFVGAPTKAVRQQLNRRTAVSSRSVFRCLRGSVDDRRDGDIMRDIA